MTSWRCADVTACGSPGVQTPRRSVDGGTQLPSARDVSLTVHRDVNLTSTRITMMVMQWGQFLDHDLTCEYRTLRGAYANCISCFLMWYAT